MHTIFVDFKKAYNDIHWGRPWVQDSGGKFNNWPSYSELGAKTRWFVVVDSVQRSLEKVIIEIKIRPNEGIRLQDTSIGLLVIAYTCNYAEIVLMKESQDRLKMLFSRL
jgi:hypothetical protein